MSASTGRWSSSATAVGTTTVKFVFQRSQSFQKLSNTPSPRNPWGVTRTMCAPEHMHPLQTG